MVNRVVKKLIMYEAASGLSATKNKIETTPTIVVIKTNPTVITAATWAGLLKLPNNLLPLSTNPCILLMNRCRLSKIVYMCYPFYICNVLPSLLEPLFE